MERLLTWLNRPGLVFNLTQLYTPRRLIDFYFTPFFNTFLLQPNMRSRQKQPSFRQTLAHFATLEKNAEQAVKSEAPPPPATQPPTESDQPKDFSSIIEKLKTGVRRSSNSSSVSTTSMTGAIEMTSGPVEGIAWITFVV